MKKALNITLNGVIFNIEEDAYLKLEDYLKSIQNHYGSTDGKEILSDIESSIAEKFAKKITNNKKVITLIDVEKIIKIMGKAEDFSEEESKKNSHNLNEEDDEKESETPKRLYRNPDDTIIAGVCSGIAAYFNLDPVFIRILFLALIFLHGLGFILYIIFWLVMPEAKTNAQKLEMSGQKVNLKKLDQVIKLKTKEITTEGKKVITKNKGIINKILVFPINLIRQCFTFLKKIIKVSLPLTRITLGILTIIVVFFAIVALSLVSGILIFNVNSSYIISDIPLNEIAISAYYKIGVVAIYLSALIPLIFLIIFAFSLILKKNLFRALASLALIILWMLAVVTAGVSTIELIPLAKEKTDELLAENTITKNLNFNDFTKIRIGGEADVTVKKGEEFAYVISGNKEAIERFEYENVDGELKINQSNKSQGLCIFCLDKTVDIEITVPDLDSFIAYGKIDAELEDFKKDITVNKGESADITVNVSTGTLSSYIAGINGRLEIIGSPQILKATLEGYGRIEADELETDLVEIDANVISRVYLEGKTKELALDLNDSAKFFGFELNSEKISIITKDNTYAEINPLMELKAEANDNSEIIYKNMPQNLSSQEYKNGNIEYLGNDRDVINMNFEDKNYSVIIKTDVDTYSPSMSSIRGIKLTPYFNEFYDDDYEFYWSTDRGDLITDWVDGILVKEIINNGEKVYWTFGEDNLDDLDNGEKIFINLDIKYNEEYISGTELKIEKVSPGFVKIIQ